MRLAERREGEAVSDEPKTLTPEPATLQGLIVTLGVHGYSLAFQEGRWWAVPPQDAPYEWSDGDTPWEAASKALGVRVVARDEAAELRAALRTLVTDLEALMEESHIELYDGDGYLVGVSWGKLLQGGKDEYLSNWNEAKRLAGGESER